MKLKLLLLLPLVFVQTACASNQAAQDYYAAVKASQDAQTMIAAARYQALAQMAQSGDPGAATAATMAIALSQTPTITPQYIESGALKWAQVLTPAVTTVGMGALSAWTSVNASDNAKDVQLASFSTNEAIQLGQQNMVSTLGTQWAGAAAAGGQASADIAVAGFNALNVAGGQTVELGVAGLNTADSIATTGFTTVDSVATTGITTVGAVGVAGFTQIGLTAEDGINATGNVGIAGMNNLVTLGQSGFTALNTMNTTHAGTLVDLNAAWGGALADANATNLAGQSNYAQAIADMQATINQLGADLADPITCSPNADGLYICQ